MADTMDLKSIGRKLPCGFKSRLDYHIGIIMIKWFVVVLLLLVSGCAPRLEQYIEPHSEVLAQTYSVR